MHARTLRLPVLAFLLASAMVASGCTSGEVDAPAAAVPGDGATAGPLGGTVKGPPSATPASPTGASATGPKVEVTALSADKGLVEPGEAILVSIGLRNTGDAEGSGTLTLLVEGEPVTTGAFTVPAGRESVESFRLTLSAPGAHLISVLATGAQVNVGPVDVEVVAAGVFALSDVTATPSTLDLGDEALITVTVHNTGGTQGKGNVRIFVGGVQLASAPVELEPGATKDVSLRVAPAVGGTLPILATVSSGSAEAAGTLVVRAPRLQNIVGTYDAQFCAPDLRYTITFDNTGDGAARDTIVRATLFDAAGTARSTEDIDLDTVFAGAHATAQVSPSVTQEMKPSCPEKRTFTLKITVTPRFGDPISIDAGPFTV